MHVLTYESPDKQQQTIEELSYEEVLLGLQEDHGWHEVINAYDQNNIVRVFFDIDSYDETDDTLPSCLEELNSIFNCTSDDWAVSNGSRPGKISYHVVSKRFCITLKYLRQITSGLNNKLPCVDHTLLFISMEASNELLFFRLPNQHKHALNKLGTPMRVVQGELKDFIVTSSLEELEEFSALSCAR